VFVSLFLLLLLIFFHSVGVEEQYAAIGGSPIRRWTETQAKLLEEKMNILQPEGAPYKCYVAFR